jgi:hypothetical protein
MDFGDFLRFLEENHSPIPLLVYNPPADANAAAKEFGPVMTAEPEMHDGE